MERVTRGITIRAALAVGMLAGFYLVVVGLPVGLAGLGVWLWLAFPGQAARDLSYLVAPIGVALVVPAWKVLRARPQPPPEGLPVSEQQAPELWSQVRELADMVGTRPPDEIRLVFEADARVREDARLLGLRPGRRYLCLGVPLLQTFTVTQVRAVLAHELAHYSLQHTRWGAVTYRGVYVIVQTILGAGPTSFAGLVYGGYAYLFVPVALAVVRRMELEADRAAVRAAGRQAAMLAFQDLIRLDKAWDGFLGGYVRWTRTRGYTPVVILARFGRLVERGAAELEQAGKLRPRPAPPFRTHPPIAERVAMMAREADPSVVPDPRRGAVLVAGLDTMAALQTTRFDEHMQRVAQEEAERDADRLYKAAATVAGDGRSGLWRVLDLLAEGRRSELRQALAPPVHRLEEPRSAEEPRGTDGHGAADGDDEILDLVLAAAAATVVACGGARWQHSWSEPMMLVSDDDEPISLRPLVTGACHDATGVARLRTFLLGLGVDEASVINWAVPGRTPLDIGPVTRTSSGTQPSTENELLLPDELFLLAHEPKGLRRVPLDAFEAGLAAAALAELRLRARVSLTDTDEAIVAVHDVTSTGDRFLDSVLARVAAGWPRPAYQWLQLLGADVADAAARRLELMGLYQPGTSGNTDPNHTPFDAARTQQVRRRIMQALTVGDLDSRDMVLGALLWGTELAGPVLGSTSVSARHWLGRLAARDRLAMAIRIVIGLNIRLE